jgi:hypothetical protein
MNKKQLAEMIKALRKKKLDEVIGKPPPFNPVTKGTKPTHGFDPNSPNVHEQMQRTGLGPRRKRKKSRFKVTLGKLEARNWGGNQSMDNRYEEVKLGPTDTGQSGEDVDVNPNIPTARGETTKNTTVKETKEK